MEGGGKPWYKLLIHSFVHRLSTGMRWPLTWKRKSDPKPDKAEESLRTRVARLEIAFGELHDELAHLQGRHERLAKRQYGAEGGRPPGRTGPESKAEIRARLGIVPGKPFQHSLNQGKTDAD